MAPSPICSTKNKNTDLIISKLFWARDLDSELQLEDVKNLLATGFDADYLKHWKRELKRDTLLDDCLSD